MDATEYQIDAMRTLCDQWAAADRIVRPTAAGAQAITETTAVQALHAAIGLANETGEITGLLQKWLWYGKPYTEDELRAKVVDEAGDVLWHLAELLSAFGLPLNTVMERNLLKLRTRYPVVWTAARAADDGRDRAAEARAVAGDTPTSLDSSP